MPSSDNNYHFEHYKVSGLDGGALDVGYMRMVCWSIGLHGINGRRETPDDDVSLEMEVHTNNPPQYLSKISENNQFS